MHDIIIYYIILLYIYNISYDIAWCSSRQELFQYIAQVSAKVGNSFSTLAAFLAQVVAAMRHITPNCGNPRHVWVLSWNQGGGVGWISGCFGSFRSSKVFSSGCASFIHHRPSSNVLSQSPGSAVQDKAHQRRMPQDAVLGLLYLEKDAAEWGQWRSRGWTFRRFGDARDTQRVQYGSITYYHL